MRCRAKHDVTSEADWQAVVSSALQTHGRIDVLLNNAGVFLAAPLVETSLEDFRRVIDVNVVGVFLGMRAVAPSDGRAARGVDHQRVLGRRADRQPLPDRLLRPASGRSAA